MPATRSGYRIYEVDARVALARAHPAHGVELGQAAAAEMLAAVAGEGGDGL